MNIFEQIEHIKQEFDTQSSELKSRRDLNIKSIDDLRVAFLGRKGSLTTLYSKLKQIDPSDKPRAGKLINQLRNQIESTIEQLKLTAQTLQEQKILDSLQIDISLPPTDAKLRGSLHPVSLMQRRLKQIFWHMGFDHYDGPEIDHDFYNFSALNFPDDHPARDMQDTFFIDQQPRWLLRTHTSNIQIHAMLNEKPPLRIFAIGRTYRCDSDATHTPMFHQVEGFMVDEHINFAHMKGVIDRFLKEVFGPKIATRLRPSFFPFVEPGAEVDMQCVHCQGKGCRVCKETGWLEVGGCGMIHPNVFEAAQYDSERYTGFAFGFGVDRLAMLYYGLDDLRTLFEAPYEFLQQFPICN